MGISDPGILSARFNPIEWSGRKELLRLEERRCTTPKTRPRSVKKPERRVWTRVYSRAGKRRSRRPWNFSSLSSDIRLTATLIAAHGIINDCVELDYRWNNGGSPLFLKHFEISRERRLELVVGIVSLRKIGRDTGNNLAIVLKFASFRWRRGTSTLTRASTSG